MSDLCPVYAPFFSAMVSSGLLDSIMPETVFNDEVDRAAPVLSSSRVSNLRE